MPNSAYVTAGKPKIGGAVFRAPLGTTLPTDATTSLDAAFKDLGYCSEDGVTNANTIESDNIKAWGGDTVLALQTDKTDTFTFTLIEGMNEDVLKAVFGDSNVSGALATGLTVKANSQEQIDHCWVIDMLYKNNAKKRVVIPVGKVSEIGEITYADGDAVGYEITITATPDTQENTHYEYIVSATT